MLASWRGFFWGGGSPDNSSLQCIRTYFQSSSMFHKQEVAAFRRGVYICAEAALSRKSMSIQLFESWP